MQQVQLDLSALMEDNESERAERGCSVGDRAVGVGRRDTDLILPV